MKVCPKDDYTLIFVCNATGHDIDWWFTPFIPSSSALSIDLYEPGDSESRGPVNVYITNKIMVALRPLDIMIESQLHISTKAILGEQPPFLVVCESDDVQEEISITKLGKSFVFSNSLVYTIPSKSRYSECFL